MDTFSMLPLHITPETFGGERFWTSLFDVGLLKRTCPLCATGEEVEVVAYESKNSIPYTNCHVHGKRSCVANGFFGEEGIDDPAKFVFFVACVAKRMSKATIKALGGYCDRTMTKYQRIVERTMVKTIDDLVQNDQMKLGGPGKVVEIDEAYFTVEKYGMGREPAKKVWILGMAEVDEPVVEVTDINTRMAVRKHRELQLKRRTKRTKRLRARVQPGDEIPASPFVPSLVPYVVEEAIEEEEVGEETVRLTVPPEDANEGVEVRERIDRLNRLYHQEKGEGPRRVLFFRVEDRTQEELEQLILQHVRPHSTIFTDEWPGYNHLNDLGYRHYTVCHKREFSRNVIEGTRIIRVTTNHIERLWLELRETTAHMTLSASCMNLNFESYRQLVLWSKDANENLRRLLLEIARLHEQFMWERSYQP